MCEIDTLSRHIGRVGRRSFDRRMRMASPSFVERRGDMSRLLNSVGALSEQLHREFGTISAEDYRSFGDELKIVIDTLKSLQKESRGRKDMLDDNKRLRQRIADLEEIVHDIVAFRVKAPKNKELQDVMAQIGRMDYSKLLSRK